MITSLDDSQGKLLKVLGAFGVFLHQDGSDVVVAKVGARDKVAGEKVSSPENLLLQVQVVVEELNVVNPISFNACLVLIGFEKYSPRKLSSLQFSAADQLEDEIKIFDDLEGDDVSTVAVGEPGSSQDWQVFIKELSSPQV